ncbi:MAG: hypothetical protein ACTSR1_14690 [Candidatus Heimdallarchaeota archaeon]
MHPFREKNIKELYPDDSLPNREIVEKNQLAGWPGFEDHYYIVYKDELEQEIIATLHYSYVRKDAPDYEKNKNNSYLIMRKIKTTATFTSLSLVNIGDKVLVLNCLKFS